MPKQQVVDDITRDLIEAAGRPIVDVSKAAELVGCSMPTIRAAIYSGELVGSRRAKNAPLRIACRDLAGWIVAGQRHSLPAAREARP